MYAEVLIEYPTKKIDKYFTYLVPERLKDIIKPGMKVQVPFGNRIINGFVMHLINTYNEEYELKEIVNIVDKELVLNDELMKLGKYIQESTLCPLISAYQAMLPSALKIKDNDTNYNYFKTYIFLNKSKEEIIKYLNEYKKNNKQSEILNKLLETEKLLKKDYSISAINSLKSKDLIKEVKEQEYRINKSSNNKLVKHKLNEEQLNAYNTISNTNKNEIFLLEGVTGSGKTEIYLNLINNVIENNKTAIILVPEISLTMQIVNRFYEWFGSNVAIFHSALSQGEKYDEYIKVLRGEVKVVVGTRSAIFTPLKNIGIIIIDEEHSDTYKQDNTPRYNAINVSKERCKYHNCPLVLGSATPTLETRARAIKGVYKHIKLTKRVGNSVLPNVEIIDMLPEVKKHNFVFSDDLIANINDKLAKNEQVILLLNRRGYSTTITCSLCGFTYKCPNCDITLTYHKSTNNLRCHYCGYTIKNSNKCPNCSEEALSYLGLGTEKVEKELEKLIPTAKIIRMDQDTTSKKGAHEKIINDFKEHKYDILLGTQMISKGLDFPNVTLVGILNADTNLNIPDFRSNERTFSLLYQASGRAGRSSLKGNVILQTYNPDNYVLNCVKNNDFNSFYNYEMNIRHIMKYPPYYYLVGLKIISKDYNIAIEHANKVYKYLKDNLNNETIILGPTTANLFKFNNTYRFQIVIKYRFDNKLMNVLNDLDKLYININNVNLEIDIDPLHI
jgi:primosomal protein N' (replication factor Y)